MNRDSIIGAIIFYYITIGDYRNFEVGFETIFGFVLFSNEFFPSTFILIKLGRIDSGYGSYVILIKLFVGSDSRY